jgi:zinc protease
MDDVKDFFYRFYRPQNATLVVAGNIGLEKVKELSEKWFGPIDAGVSVTRKLPLEPIQVEKRVEHANGKVPANSITKVFHMGSRLDPDYHATDLMSDILGRGKSSRLYSELVRDKGLFSSVNCFVTGSSDPGLLVVNGKLNEGVEFQVAEQQIDSILYSMKDEIDQPELDKAKNQAESTLVFQEMELLNRAMKLAFFATLGDPSLANREVEEIRAVQPSDIRNVADKVLREENSSVLYYHSN